MKDYLLWLQNQQTQKPEWKAANQWQKRNQSPVKKIEDTPKEEEKEIQEPTEE